MDVMIHGGNFIGRGAEAMMLAVQTSLAAQVPGARCCTIVNEEEDRQRALSQGLMPLWPKLPLFPVRFWRRVWTRLGFAPGYGGRRISPDAFVSRRMSNPFRCTQWLVDVSGFASSDQFLPANARARWVRMRAIRKLGNRIIYMPQSWGPFRNPRWRDYTRRLLAEAELVFAREAESYAHLTALDPPDPGVIRQAPDLAFQFHACDPERASAILDSIAPAAGDGPLIGFTPNMRIYERTPGEGLQNPYFSALVELMRFFTDRHAARIVLIAHELSRGRKNDPELCQELATAAARERQVAIAPITLSAAEVKGLIGGLEFLVASRYHSLVAAFSLRVPVGVIGWAHKYNDLMQAAGLSRWVADPVRGDAGDMGAIIREAWSQREAIRAAQHASVPEIERLSASAVAQMCAVIGASAS